MNVERRVIEVIEHGAGVRELVLERQDMDFVPGDCVALFAGDGVTSRPYSIASGTGEDVLRFLIRCIDGGQVSPYLCGMVSGGAVAMSPPFGWFRPAAGSNGSGKVYVATGTGIAPFLSSMRSQPGETPTMCLYGVRRRSDAIDVPWLKSRCDLRLAVSREVAPGCHHGRVTDLLDKMPRAADTHYYLCGLDIMIDEITAWLETRTIPITQIHRECFFNASFEENQDEGAAHVPGARDE